MPPTDTSQIASQIEMFPQGHPLNKDTAILARLEDARQRAQEAKDCRVPGRPIEDWTGRRFGKLLIIAQEMDFQGAGTAWVAQCDCGEVISIAKTSLYSGASHCGCMGWGRGSLSRPGTLGLRSSIRKSSAMVPFNQMYANYRMAAAKRGYEWRLSKEEFAEITKQDCFYCGVIPKQEYRHGDAVYVYNGIDRMDSSMGYIKGNVVPCCGVCNIAKMDRDIEQFREWIIRVHSHWIK